MIGLAAFVDKKKRKKTESRIISILPSEAEREMEETDVSRGKWN